MHYQSKKMELSMIDESPCILYNEDDDDDNIITFAYTGRCTHGIRRSYKILRFSIGLQIAATDCVYYCYSRLG